MSEKPLRVGTRTSELALTQSATVAELLGDAELVPVKTEDTAVGDKARFVRAIEQALLAGTVDVAVHSAKDLPGDEQAGLRIGAVPPRASALDAWCGDARSLDEVPDGARVGTASLRRRSQLLALRPDLEVAEIRGNVDTRLGKLAAGDFDGIVLAHAGLQRLGREDAIGFLFGAEEMTPAPGQGALAVQISDSADQALTDRTKALGDEAALTEWLAERAATIALGADCETPVGVHAELHSDRLAISGFAGLPDGSRWVRDRIEGDASEPAALGAELAARMLSAGAAEILELVHEASTGGGT